MVCSVYSDQISEWVLLINRTLNRSGVCTAGNDNDKLQFTARNSLAWLRRFILLHTCYFRVHNFSPSTFLYALSVNWYFKKLVAYNERTTGKKNRSATASCFFYGQTLATPSAGKYLGITISCMNDISWSPKPVETEPYHTLTGSKRKPNSGRVPAKEFPQGVYSTDSSQRPILQQYSLCWSTPRRVQCLSQLGVSTEKHKAHPCNKWKDSTSSSQVPAWPTATPTRTDHQVWLYPWWLTENLNRVDVTCLGRRQIRSMLYNWINNGGFVTANINQLSHFGFRAILTIGGRAPLPCPLQLLLFPYWAIQRSWFAGVNTLCNLSRKKSQEVAAHFRADFCVGVASRCV